ncbi:MAG: hypothetical protein IPL86_13275 [Flavobacteriales bacterium]|nr:hypothetical protein [Flavobacteriales bacterium]
MVRIYDRLRLPLQKGEIPFQIGGKTPESDLNLRVDLSWRQNNTVICK